VRGTRRQPHVRRLLDPGRPAHPVGEVQRCVNTPQAAASSLVTVPWHIVVCFSSVMQMTGHFLLLRPIWASTGVSSRETPGSAFLEIQGPHPFSNSASSKRSPYNSTCPGLFNSTRRSFPACLGQSFSTRTRSPKTFEPLFISQPQRHFHFRSPNITHLSNQPIVYLPSAGSAPNYKPAPPSCQVPGRPARAAPGRPGPHFVRFRWTKFDRRPPCTRGPLAPRTRWPRRGRFGAAPAH